MPGAGAGKISGPLSLLSGKSISLWAGEDQGKIKGYIRNLGHDNLSGDEPNEARANPGFFIRHWTFGIAVQHAPILPGLQQRCAVENGQAIDIYSPVQRHLNLSGKNDLFSRPYIANTVTAFPAVVEGF